jgi:hypothetical protein
LKLRFAEKMSKNLPIFGIDKNNLVDFTTTEKDMKRGTSRFPPKELRIKSEDIMVENTVDSSAIGKGILEDSEVVEMTFT